ncbi:MAG TPA: MarR family transcriptional regulator [Rhizobacter sp.]|nr:MarR family transcriptional regulator [Rhizobacter sp.]
MSRKGARSDEVLELVHSVMHLYRARQYQVLRDGPHDITHMEGKVLGYFAAHPGATQSDLAQHSGRDKAQLARLIKTLRDQGLLSGEVGESDRRSVSLSLTDEGQSVLRSLQQQAKRLHAQAVAGLSPAEEQQLLALLRRVKANLEPEA